MEELKFRLDSFEGPLDLLLMLIKKNKVSIYDIPIALILEQYLEVMNRMKEMDLEISSEFLVLAATLLQIKSKMLLPKEESEEEEGVDPREELVKRLAEYKKIKEAVPFFRERENIGIYMFFKTPDVIERKPPELDTSSLTADNLIEAYRRAYRRLERVLPPPKASFTGIVGHERVSIKSRVLKLFNKLKTRSKVFFKDLFKGTKTRAEAVASFLAVLELIRIKKLQVEYSENGDISNPNVYLKEDAEIDLDMNIIDE